MKLLNNHYFSTLSCYNTRLLDSLQAKFLRLPSRSRPFILPCSCKFSVCPKNRVSVFRFMKKTCIFLYFFLSQKRCKECALAHSGVSRGRLRQFFASRECASSRSFFHRTQFSMKKKNRCKASCLTAVFFVSNRTISIVLMVAIQCTEPVSLRSHRSGSQNGCLNRSVWTDPD